MELSSREKEVQRNKEASNKKNCQNISSCKRTQDDDSVFDHLKDFLTNPLNGNDDTDNEGDSKLAFCFLISMLSACRPI